MVNPTKFFEKPSDQAETSIDQESSENLSNCQPRPHQNPKPQGDSTCQLPHLVDNASAPQESCLHDNNKPGKKSTNRTLPHLAHNGESRRPHENGTSHNAHHYGWKYQKGELRRSAISDTNKPGPPTSHPTRPPTRRSDINLTGE